MDNSVGGSMRNGNPKISIIIPVYNVEKYLKECMDSIVRQTLKDIEIIVINDGSTDNSRKILEEYKEENVIIIDKANGGLSSARNIGIIKAKGKYVMFVDSDDYINDNMCEELFKIAEETGSDVVKCGMRLFFEESDKEDYILYKQKEDVKSYSNEEVLKKYFSYEIRGYICSMIVNRNFLIENDIKFPEGFYYEDILPSLKILNVANTTTLVNKSFYNYRQRNTSISNTIKEKNVKDYIIQVEKCIDYYDKNVDIKSIYEYMEAFKILNYLNAINWYIKLQKFDLERIKKNYLTYFKHLDINKNISTIFKLKNLKFSYKIIYVLWKINIYHLFIKFNII